ncbi:DUF664 domain-containing protein [Nocardioides sp. cx-173]|uniref:mycothiol transferase n=1 Tax=Nocardioides sp. cx-173 TaxID=2898796 RepID=UPI001E310BEC|nr:DUF664 domain-containing protein [Nocardioides sp. cx-173]MCD4523786.1 DinB family protein [Nocardioides sp. cx-173]UGB41891.1 DinB family protein [Nocardioides sp. cx-173]
MAERGRDGYAEPPEVGSEAETLAGSLQRQRATFIWKCEGLDAAGLSARVGRSELTLGRLLKHLAYMEDLNFTRDLGHGPLPRPWSLQEPETRSRWVFESADHDPPAVLYELWHDAVDRSDAVLRTALTHEHGPAATYRPPAGRRLIAIRRLMVDMIEEYGRHTGQADLLRESVDGRVGEDPPGPAVPFRF